MRSITVVFLQAVLSEDKLEAHIQNRHQNVENITNVL